MTWPWGMVKQAADYRWSSAVAHLSGKEERGWLDMVWWKRAAPAHWGQILRQDQPEQFERLRARTYAGRPCGDEEFVKQVGERFGRQGVRGRPRKKKPAQSLAAQEEQFSLF